MDVPGIVEEALEGEEVAARVALGGDDVLYVTATRTLLYRDEGLLKDESIEQYSHEAERITVSVGRRKAKVSLTYPIEGTEEISLPAGSVDEAITPIVAGVLNANGVIDPGESVLDTYRFSELTVIVTSARLIKHVGGAVWDEEHEEYRYEDVTGVTFEKGSVATQIVLEVDGRQERIKAPNERARELQQTLEDAIREYHDLGPHEDLGTALQPDEEEEEDPDLDDEGEEGMGFGEGLSALETSGVDEPDEGDEPADAGDGGAVTAGSPGGSADEQPEPDRAAGGGAAVEDAGNDPFEEAGFESAGESSEVAEELAELRELVEEQNRTLARQQETIEKLIEELRRGR